MAVVTARGSTHAIASRCSAPYLGIDEDPVDGLGACRAGPLLGVAPGRTAFSAVQASKRGGVLECRLEGDRVVLGGQCRTVIVGQFQL